MYIVLRNKRRSTTIMAAVSSKQFFLTRLKKHLGNKHHLSTVDLKRPKQEDYSLLHVLMWIPQWSLITAVECAALQTAVCDL